MAKLGQKCAISLPDIVEACMLCGIDDADMLRLRDGRGKRYIDDAASIEAARCQIVSRWAAHYAGLDCDLRIAYTARLYGAVLQRMETLLSGRIGRRLKMAIEQGIIEVTVARYRLLMQAGRPGTCGPNIDGPRLGVQRLEYDGGLP